MDKTTYLNHYYFISILSFLMIFLPANSSYSVDSYLNYEKVYKWNIESGTTMNRSTTFKNRLTSNYDLPLIGTLLQKRMS